ncbi:MAG: substrate-binding domain-containing protein [Actinomycetia bacterium]|nr:substrate-binding domain-containing protein [Actinomycetes bacterium]
MRPATLRLSAQRQVGPSDSTVRVGARGWRLGVIAAVTVALGSACGSNSDLLVLSAASAQDAVRVLASDQSAAVASGGSNALVRQLAGGARGDVLITADARTMAAAAEQGLLSADPITFATSELVLAVPATQTAVSSLADLKDADLSLVVCAPEVPCGWAARPVLEQQGLRDQVRSLEPNSRQALAKLRLGQVDAALVWAVDIAGNETLRAISLATETDPTHYQAAVTRQAVAPAAARAFVQSLLSPTSQASLREQGFGSAP